MLIGKAISDEHISNRLFLLLESCPSEIIFDINLNKILIVTLNFLCK